MRADPFAILGVVQDAVAPMPAAMKAFPSRMIPEQSRIRAQPIRAWTRCRRISAPTLISLVFSRGGALEVAMGDAVR